MAVLFVLDKLKGETRALLTQYLVWRLAYELLIYIYRLGFK